MLEAMVTGALMGLAVWVVFGIANFIFDLDGERTRWRRWAEENRIAHALSDPDSPESRKLRAESDQLFSSRLERS